MEERVPWQSSQWIGYHYNKEVSLQGIIPGLVVWYQQEINEITQGGRTAGPVCPIFFSEGAERPMTKK